MRQLLAVAVHREIISPTLLALSSSVDYVSVGLVAAPYHDISLEGIWCD